MGRVRAAVGRVKAAVAWVEAAKAAEVQVMSIETLAAVDEGGAEVLRPGLYELKLGVDGAAEGRALRATLKLNGPPVTLSNLTQALL